MTKYEIINIIELFASLFGIMGEGLVTVKFVFKPYFKNRKEYENIIIL